MSQIICKARNCRLCLDRFKEPMFWSCPLWKKEANTMLNKKQILKRIEWMLEHKGVANKDWFINELETLLVSAESPEKFRSDFKEPLRKVSE